MSRAITQRALTEFQVNVEEGTSVLVFGRIGRVVNGKRNGTVRVQWANTATQWVMRKDLEPADDGRGGNG